VLFYYNFTRPHEREIESKKRTGKIGDSEERVDKRKEFEAALHTSKEAEAIWARATVDHHLDPPL